MFTPSFVMIPAREIIPGKEIGLIAAWFTISQVLAFVFPVLFLWSLNWVSRVVSGSNKQSSKSIPMDQSRRGSMATISGVEWEKGISFAGGQKLGPLATGLSGLTAHMIAPISHLPMDIDADAWRQLESTALEQARQQGDPAVTTHHGSKDSQFSYCNYSPKSDVSNFQHLHHHHNNHQHRPTIDLLFHGRSKSSPAHNQPVVPSPTYSFPAKVDSTIRAKDDIDVIDLESDATTRVNSRNPSQLDLDLETRRNSKIVFDIPKLPSKDSAKTSDDGNDNEVKLKDFASGSKDSINNTGNHGDDKEEEETAAERMSSWISEFITPTIYFIFFLVGIPLYFVADVALPLFLGVNILTFIAAITIVPPKVRRFAHPILTCSIVTVLIIWAFGAMRGIGLKNNLNRFYAVNAGYLELWSLSGYSGPIPGAGDILFSTLDAGIVALAVPMYRYRKELKQNFFKMIAVLFPCACLSLFFWNWIAKLMGMDPLRSLAFTARFMSTPLAIELAGNIGADESITVILVVLTGILAAILKDYFFRLMRVDREDHLIVGITMGSTAGAIGASSLISTPKVMAVASLSFVIFGTILLIATAIPPIVDVVRMLS